MFQSLRTQCLVSATHLRDTNFFKSVILLIEHTKTGAMGVIINRPMDVSITEALSKNFELPESDKCLYSGGPVEPTALLILHGDYPQAESKSEVMPGLFVGTQSSIFDTIAESLNDPSSTFQYRLFAGYSGWDGGQLESEIARGDWYLIPGDASYVFRDDPYEVWEDLLRKVHEQSGVISDRTQKHEWN